MKLIFYKVFLLLMVLQHQLLGSACTEVHINKSGIKLVGNNFDWPTGDGFIIIKPRGIYKNHQAISNASWVSKYGSVTIDLALNTAAQQGINEKGLSVAGLVLRTSEYAPPLKNSDKVIMSALWMQYILDNYKSVHDAIRHAHDITVIKAEEKYKAPAIHLFLCDRTGKSAIFEYLNGQLIIYSDNEVQVPILTNTAYSDALAHLATFKGFGGNAELTNVDNSSSLDRFVKLAYLMREQKKQISTATELLHLLKTVERLRPSKTSSSLTYWHVIKNLTDLSMQVRTLKSPGMKYINLSEIDFSRGQPLQVLDVNAHVTGNALQHFKAYNEIAKLHAKQGN